MSRPQVRLLIAATMMAAVFLDSAVADDTNIVTGLQMGANHTSTLNVLEDSCETVSEVGYDNVRYPLAANSEVHLVCEGYRAGPIGFRRAAFVIADGLLTQVEALEVNVDGAHETLGEPDGVYLGMNNYQRGTIWLDTANRKLFWLSMDARHPNLFAWSNPALGNRVVNSHSRSTRIPALLDFSASLEELRPRFEAQCPQIVIHENERIWLPNKPKQQVQIDCFGLTFAGFERKFEAVFGDGKLEVIWVLTGKPEESRLRELLHQDWGKPTLVNDSWEVFGAGRISLYKDKPEFLILSDDMIPLYRGEFEGK